MSQKRRHPRRNGPVSPSSPSNTKTPVIYIAIVSVMVFSLIIAGLASVDFSSLFSADTEPAPDYEIDQVAIQQTAVAESPGDAEAQQLLASMLANSGRMQEAVPVFEEAIRLDPENANVRLEFARSLQANGMTADAEAQFLRVLELEPRNHIAHYYLGRLYLEWQPSRQKEAIVHLEQVVEIAPDSFLAEQATGVLTSLGPVTPTEYQVTPMASPQIPQ